MATSSKDKNTKYRSGLEERFDKETKHKLAFEPYKLPYVVNRHYIPDFVYNRNDNHEVLVECKGFFRVGDTQKYKSIRDCLTKKQELVFLFSNATKKLRKGSKMTLGQWCDKEGFKYYTMDTLDELKDYLGINK